MSQLPLSPTLPSVMELKLRAIRRRQAVLAIARAVATGAATLLAAMLAAMIVDWSLTLFHTGVRAALTVSSLVLAPVALLATGVRPLVAALGWTRAAASADEAAPQLEERWTTVASFAGSDRQPASPAARAMLQQVISEAAAMGRLVEPRRAVQSAALRPALLALAGCAVALAGFLALDWPQTSVLLRRFWSPLANITATQLTSVTGDAKIPRGESLELVTELSGVPRSAAILTVQHDSGAIDVFELQPDASRPAAFVHALRVDDSFRYQVRAGDGQTGWHIVAAIDYPELAEVRFTITAPEYVDRPPYEKALIPRRVKVVQGSRLELLMRPSIELERLELTVTAISEEDDSTERVLALVPDADGWYRFEAQLLQHISLSPMLFSSHGLTNQEKPLCRIEVQPDKAPVVRVISPTDEMAVSPEETIEIKFEAHDDHGIATAELVAYDETGRKEGEVPKVVSVQEIPLGDQQFAKYITASTQLDLKQLNVPAGTNISYAIRVTDNRTMPVDPDASEPALAEAKPGERPSADAGEQQKTASRDRGTGSETSDTRRTGGAQQLDAKVAADQSALADPSDGRSAANEPDRQTAEKHADPAPSSETADSAQLAMRNPAAEQDPDDGAPEQSAGTEAEKDSTPEKRPSLENSGEDSAPETPASDKPPSESSTAETPEPAGDISPAQPEDAPNSGEPADRDRQEAKSGDTAVAASKTPDAEPANEPDAERMTDGEESVAGAQEARQDAKTADPRETPVPAAGIASNDGSPPPSQPLGMSPQQASSGQNAESNRRLLKITERMTAVAEADDRRTESSDIRDQVVQIDRMLAAIEAELTGVVQRQIPDADRGRQFQVLDQQLGEVETYIAQLHEETRDGELAFAGLQMVDIRRTHVTPARDRVFVAIRDPAGADGYATESLQHVVRARELLAALLERYDRVVRERELASSLEETVTMYEVYVEKMQRLMREARQNINPLERKMAVIEVDQEYLDRYAEVLTLRREMLREFGRMLADDPRLMARYLDLIKRRRTSLRDQLSELVQRQDEIAVELSGWLQIDETQRPDLWMLIVESRLHATTPLAKDAAELAERIEKQMPLVLEPSHGTAASVIAHAREIARLARAISFDAREFVSGSGEPEGAPLTTAAEQLVGRFSQLDAALDRLNFENEDEDEVTSYVSARLLESRTVADQADAWAAVARHIQEKAYHGLAHVDQHKLSVATELLRVAMLDMENDLDAQFQQQTDSGTPAEILSLVRELHRTMEAITFNQAAATFAMTRQELDEAELQQARALEGFERAEELFDRIRREVVAALDEYDVPDPNIADLLDPTLDEFLAQLEREPNIEAQLGIPNRPRNLRAVADTLIWQQTGGDMLGDSGDAAMQRAREAMKEQPRDAGKKPPEREITEEEREQLAKEKEMQDMLAKSLASLEQKARDPEASPEERRRFEQMAENIRRMLDRLEQQGPDAQAWEELAESDQAKAILQALARGEAIPDQQWNRLLSTLEDGLWQVRGKTPPAEYRKAIEQYQDRIRQLMSIEE